MATFTQIGSPAFKIPAFSSFRDVVGSQPHTKMCCICPKIKDEAEMLTAHQSWKKLGSSKPRILAPLIHSISRSLFPSSLPLSRSFSSMSNSVTFSGHPAKARLKGVVFDMDGTLTVPVIDFLAMYKAVLGEEEYLSAKRKNPSGIDILHYIEDWSSDKQKKAFEIIADFEKEGLDRLQIMPGASELCDFLSSRNIRRGLITRNVKAAVDLFHQRFGMTFSPALSREFRPYKPDPAPLLHICSAWEVQPHEVMMIGDSLKDDVACGKRAGAYTCLLDETGRYDAPEYENAEYKPDYKVSSLAEVSSILKANFDLTPQLNSA